jgi:hypothetical protein
MLGDAIASHAFKSLMSINVAWAGTAMMHKASRGAGLKTTH